MNPTSPRLRLAAPLLLALAGCGGGSPGVEPSRPPLSLTGITPGSGPVEGGAVVTLTGSGFVAGPGGSRVAFGGAPAAVTSATETALVVTAPAQAGPGPVAVTVANPDGQVASLPLGYAYLGPPPVVEVLSVRGAPPGGGTRLNILGSGFQPGVTATFGGAPATGLVISAAAPPRQYLTLTTPPSPPGAGPLVELVVRNPDGQSATFAGFHYGPPPSVTSVSVAPPGSVGDVHRGDTITIAGADFDAGAGVLVQIGQYAAFTAASATELVVVAPRNNPGTYPVVVTNQDGQFVVAPAAYSLVYQGP